ncbi:uncharacterized protein LOC116966738 [Amblyraja radiata]|uniref:uncharacterized protein LOC116966738 n=1 Tax=Amblyraja radiata TaxID=386614 RepID=UPI001402EE65|nr:uncharacterized protein LOC116966738 [Amblyraja radiata]
MAEHAAFCNGPSNVVLPDRAISCHSLQQEQDPSSCSQHPEKDASSQVTSNIIQLFRSYANVTEPVVPSAAAGSVVPRTSGKEDGNSQNVTDVVAHLMKVGRQLDTDVELNRLLQPLLNSNTPLQVLQELIKAIFGKGNFSSYTPFIFLFYLSKRFLPGILESESWATFMKWLEVFVTEVVAPWISKMGGWEGLLCALGSLLAAGLVVGLKMLLTKS